MVNIKHPVARVSQHQLSFLFTVKFRKDLWRKLELKLTQSLKSVAAKSKRSTKQLYIHIYLFIIKSYTEYNTNQEYKPYVRRH